MILSRAEKDKIYETIESSDISINDLVIKQSKEQIEIYYQKKGEDLKYIITKSNTINYLVTWNTPLHLDVQKAEVKINTLPGMLNGWLTTIHSEVETPSKFDLFESRIKFESSDSTNAMETFNIKEIKLINIRIDIVKDEISNQKLMDGLEIVFDDLDEMKTMLKSMKKKSWGQLFKEKLRDHALGQVISIENALAIWNYVIEEGGEVLKLN